MRARSALCLAVATVALLAVAAPAAANACPHEADPATALSLADQHAAILCALNTERGARGLLAVSENGLLSHAAQGHADDMVARGFFAHVTPGGSTLLARIRATGYVADRRDWSLGETIAWAQDPLDTAGTLVRAWLASPEHRDVLLDPEFREVGIGLALGLPIVSEIGGATAVLDFGTRSRSPTLRAWAASASTCARMARTSQRVRGRCASTSTRSRR
jgi:uncharacterized protein YkwD